MAGLLAGQVKDAALGALGPKDTIETGRDVEPMGGSARGH
jgi:hypothetical protein